MTTSASSRQSAGAMDAQRKADTVLAIRARALDVSQWVSGVLQWADDSSASGQSISVNDNSSAATVERFFARLSTGVQLCHLLDTLSSSAHRVTHVHEDAAAGSFQARDNIARFIKSAQALGVSPLVCFDTDDLALRANDKKVVNTLMELSRQSAIKYNVTPTKLMQFDMEWEQMQQLRNSQQQQASNKAADKAEEDDDHEVESLMTANTQRYEADEKEQPTTPAARSAIIAPAGQSNRPAVLTPQPVAHDNDAIDSAISALISAHHFNIPITRVAIKSKKKRRDARKAEYRVGSGPKLFVRLLHGHLIAKAEDEWVDFADAVQDRIRHEIAAGH